VLRDAGGGGGGARGLQPPAPRNPHCPAPPPPHPTPPHPTPKRHPQSPHLARQHAHDGERRHVQRDARARRQLGLVDLVAAADDVAGAAAGFDDDCGHARGGGKGGEGRGRARRGGRGGGGGLEGTPRCRRQACAARGGAARRAPAPGPAAAPDPPGQTRSRVRGPRRAGAGRGRHGGGAAAARRGAARALTALLVELPQDLADDLPHALQSLQVVLRLVILLLELLDGLPQRSDLGVDLLVLQQLLAVVCQRLLLLLRLCGRAHGAHEPPGGPTAKGTTPRSRPERGLTRERAQARGRGASGWVDRYAYIGGARGRRYEPAARARRPLSRRALPRARRAAPRGPGRRAGWGAGAGRPAHGGSSAPPLRPQLPPRPPPPAPPPPRPLATPPLHATQRSALDGPPLITGGRSEGPSAEGTLSTRERVGLSARCHWAVISPRARTAAACSRRRRWR
jgi:hypothetical protein